MSSAVIWKMHSLTDNLDRSLRSPSTAPRALPGEWDVLFCLFPLPKELWASHRPALPLPGSVPGTTAGFSSFPTQSWAGRTLQTKSVTATSRAGLGKSHTTKMFLFEEGTSFPPSLSPGWEASGGPLSSRSAQQASLQGSSRDTGKPQPGLGPRGGTINTAFISTEPLRVCTGSLRGRDRGGPVTRTQRWWAWRSLPTPREIPPRFPCSALQPRCLN